jgi:hypothetical protein
MRLALAVFLLVVGACRSTAADELPLLGQIEDRDHVLLIHGGGVYTVKGKDGSVLAEGIDAATLEHDYPELFDLVTDSPDERTVEVFY